jgi:hypothetical protein
MTVAFISAIWMLNGVEKSGYEFSLDNGGAAAAGTDCNTQPMGDAFVAAATPASPATRAIGRSGLT